MEQESSLFLPLTPTQGDNDGMVRDRSGRVIADCFGHKAVAEVIAVCVNRVLFEEEESTCP